MLPGSARRQGREGERTRSAAWARAGLGCRLRWPRPQARWPPAGLTVHAVVLLIAPLAQDGGRAVVDDGGRLGGGEAAEHPRHALHRVGLRGAGVGLCGSDSRKRVKVGPAGPCPRGGPTTTPTSRPSPHPSPADWRTRARSRDCRQRHSQQARQRPPHPGHRGCWQRAGRRPEDELMAPRPGPGCAPPTANSQELPPPTGWARPGAEPQPQRAHGAKPLGLSGHT